MDIKASWEEIKKIILGKEKDDEKTGLRVFGGGLHLHFHISINPTFKEREKDSKTD